MPADSPVESAAGRLLKAPGCTRADKRHVAAVYYTRPLRYLGFRKWFWVGCYEPTCKLKYGPFPEGFAKVVALDVGY